MNNDIEKVLLTEEEIRKKVKELGEALTRDYNGKNPLFIGVLKGSVIFMSDLVRVMDTHVEMDFMAVSSYGNSSTSSGVVRIMKDLERDVEDRDVIIVEDIIDTGTTLKYLYEYILKRNPKTLKICALLDKPERRKVGIQADYLGFSVPDEFLVGYGLDYAEMYRYLPYVGVLKEEVYKK